MSDPRARLVLSATHHTRRDVTLVLECGHSQKRRLSCVPAQAICTQCPSAGGLGGHFFETPRVPHTRHPWPEEKRPVLDRMKFAAQQLIERRRTPRVFYLLTEDWAEFEATDPPKIVHEFNGTPCEVASFEGLAVKPSDSKVRSMLYCTAGTSTMVPPR